MKPDIKSKPDVILRHPKDITHAAFVAETYICKYSKDSTNSCTMEYGNRSYYCRTTSVGTIIVVDDGESK